ncbi:hypothetical protein HK099_008052 [Clydaea vesicula]|uniref:tRNA-guanine(15) transglycosylase-like domain-containing protein n=1 Tax=Clydaea vesicula TaxID=447962 RepID=A0AAD5TWG5_9FUNG|nr:hypothetical protein HK099_008052 [Clydaea vesicula]
MELTSTFLKLKNGKKFSTPSLVYNLNGGQINYISKNQINLSNNFTSDHLECFYDCFDVNPLDENTILYLKDYSKNKHLSSSEKFHSIHSQTCHKKLTTKMFFENALKLESKILVSPIALGSLNYWKSQKRNDNFLKELIKLKEDSKLNNKNLNLDLFAVVDGGLDIEKRAMMSFTVFSNFDKDVSGYCLPFFHDLENEDTEEVNFDDKKRNIEPLLSETLKHLPANKPKLALGIRTWRDLQTLLKLGIDLIDTNFFLEKLSKNGVALIIKDVNEVVNVMHA